MKALPASLIIVGAAATGCQLASIFAGFGVKVWLLEVAPRILRVEDECITEIIQSAFQQRGIQTITGIDGIDQVEKQSNGVILQYRISGEAAEITADAILMSTGWIGNLSSLNLPAVGVQTIGQYIKVDVDWEPAAVGTTTGFAELSIVSTLSTKSAAGKTV